jgi:RNA polymerase sigma-70 factor (ECF subfamily)
MVTWSSRADRLDDAALLAAIALGDGAACTVFVRRHQRAVYGVAVGVCGDSQLAEDVAQQTFERVWKHAASFDERRGSVRTWMLTICRRAAIDVIRARRSVPFSPDDLMFILPSTPPNQVEDLAGTSTELVRVRAAMLRLPDDQRRAVLLASLSGLTAAEIAEVEQIPLGTAKTRIRLGLRRLRSQLVSVAVADD